MKFKYMIRGLGLGVIITAAVMGAYTRNAVADARVAVLREYGFGEESRLVEGTQTDVESQDETESIVEQENMRDEQKESEINSVLDAAKDVKHADTSEPTQDPIEQPQAPEPSDGGEAQAESADDMVSEPPAATADVIEIVIARGDDSGTVARKLYNAGIIGNASEYDAFLMQHGYDKRLSTGTKSISATDSWQEIAEKLTR